MIQFLELTVLVPIEVLVIAPIYVVDVGPRPYFGFGPHPPPPFRGWGRKGARGTIFEPISVFFPPPPPHLGVRRERGEGGLLLDLLLLLLGTFLNARKVTQKCKLYV